MLHLSTQLQSNRIVKDCINKENILKKDNYSVEDLEYDLLQNKYCGEGENINLNRHLEMNGYHLQSNLNYNPNRLGSLGHL